MRFFVYDTETSGLPLYNEPSEDPRQPHLVQVAAVVYDTDTRKIVHAFEAIIRPDRWQIPTDVSEIHGITHAYAYDVGIPEISALNALRDLHAGVAFRVAHNESFDARIIRIGLMRYFTQDAADTWKASPAQCTQVQSTPILKLPPSEKMLAKGMRGHKTANLREAYQFFTHKLLADAHSAMADALACKAVWLAINDPRPLMANE